MTIDPVPLIIPPGLEGHVSNTSVLTPLQWFLIQHTNAITWGYWLVWFLVLVVVFWRGWPMVARSIQTED